jgi:voltage-gated potassium channel
VTEAASDLVPSALKASPGRPIRRLTAGQKRMKGWLVHVDWALAGVALLFLGAYAWPILEPSLSRPWRRVCGAVTFVAWAMFLIDYGMRLWVARDRRGYFAKHLLDLLIVVLPALRPLRLLRLVVLFRVLNRKAAASLRGRVPLYVTVSAGTLVVCAALAVLDAERGAAGSNIKTFGDALWWAVVTVTTVGYGDHFPVTLQGRFVAGGLMIGGVALIGVVTASFAAWFIARVRSDEEDVQAATQRDLETLTARIEELTAEVRSLRAERVSGQR